MVALDWRICGFFRRKYGIVGKGDADHSVGHRVSCLDGNWRSRDGDCGNPFFQRTRNVLAAVFHGNAHRVNCWNQIIIVKEGIELNTFLVFY